MTVVSLDEKYTYKQDFIRLLIVMPAQLITEVAKSTVVYPGQASSNVREVGECDS